MGSGNSWVAAAHGQQGCNGLADAASTLRGAHDRTRAAHSPALRSIAERESAQRAGSAGRGPDSADPAANAVAGAALIFSFYVNGGSFLAYAVMAEKRGLKTEERGEKSLFFTTGLAEATETIAFFVAFCLFPAWFSVLAGIFAVLCLYTATSRILLAARALD